MILVELHGAHKAVGFIFACFAIEEQVSCLKADHLRNDRLEEVVTDETFIDSDFRLIHDAAVGLSARVGSEGLDRDSLLLCAAAPLELARAILGILDLSTLEVRIVVCILGLARGKASLRAALI